MARFNEILHGRFNRALQKMSGIKGEVPAPQLASEILPVWPMFYGAENRLLESWFRWATDLVAGPVAAQRSAVQLLNPNASGVIVVLEKLVVLSQGTIDIPTATLGNPANPTVVASSNFLPLDPRAAPQVSSITARISTNAGAISGNPLWKRNMAVNADVEMITTDLHELVLTPGFGLTVWSNTLNLALETTFWWRERPIEDAEKVA